MQDAPPTLSSCIIHNACKKIEIMKIKLKLNVYFPKKHWVASQLTPLFTVVVSTQMSSWIL